jgi:hypothetical protein
MRRYPANSPHAAARVVALTLLADGAVSRGELGSLVRAGVYERLGLDPLAMQDVLDALARDLFEFGAPAWEHHDGVHPLVVRCVADDVTDPALRREVLEICRTVAESDGPMTDGEDAVLALASSLWRPAVASLS